MVCICVDSRKSDGDRDGKSDDMTKMVEVRINVEKLDNVPGMGIVITALRKKMNWL